MVFGRKQRKESNTHTRSLLIVKYVICQNYKNMRLEIFHIDKQRKKRFGINQMTRLNSCPINCRKKLSMISIAHTERSTYFGVRKADDLNTPCCFQQSHVLLQYGSYFNVSIINSSFALPPISRLLFACWQKMEGYSRYCSSHGVSTQRKK